MRLRIPLLIASLYLIPGVFVQNPGAILAQEMPEVPAKTRYGRAASGDRTANKSAGASAVWSLGRNLGRELSNLR